MCEVVKRGFLFMKMLSGNTEQQELDNDWERKWFLLHNTGVLKCYDSCYADQLVFRIDLKSIHVSRDDVIYPVTKSGKPWIVSVRMRERDEEMLLEADCEESMEGWAQLIVKSLSIEPKDVNILKKDYYEVMGTPEKTKPKIPPKPQLKGKFPPSLDSLSPNHKSTPGNLSSVSSCQLSDGDEELIYEYIENDMTIRELILPEHKDNKSFNQSDHRQTLFPSLLPSKPCGTDTRMKYINLTLVQNEDFTGILKDNRARALSNPSTSREESHVYEEVNYAEMLYDNSVFLKSRLNTGYPSELNKPSFLDSLTDCQKLLEDSWPMCFTLDSGEIFLQLVDLTVCIEDSLQALFNCFQHSYPSPDSYLTLQVIGDLYQTYKPQKSSKKKGMQLIDCRNSFASQGVVTSKIVRVSLRVDTDASLNSERLEKFLYGMSNLSESEMFCMSWISFVKGSFPVMDLSVSARHSACIFLIYKKITEKMSVEVDMFVPAHLQKMPHINKLLEELERMHSSDAMTLCNLFLDNLRASRSGNAICLPVVKVKKLSLRLKYIDCVFVIGKQHIGITPKKNESSRSDISSEFWKFTQVEGWLVKPSDDVVFIKLSPDSKRQDTLIFVSPNADFIDALFKQILGKNKK